MRVHTRTKRRRGIKSTHLTHFNFFSSVKRKKGERTFKTEESAHAWASKQGLKAGEYTLKKVKKNKRVQIVKFEEKKAKK